MTDTVDPIRSDTPRAAAKGARAKPDLAHLDRIADALDSRYRIPGTGIRFGWDSILGLIPGIGGLVTVLPAAIQITEGYRLGAGYGTLGRMGANTAIDLVVGGIPVIGDIFDVYFKSHKRNLALLKADLTTRG